MPTGEAEDKLRERVSKLLSKKYLDTLEALITERDKLGAALIMKQFEIKKLKEEKCLTNLPE